MPHESTASSPRGTIVLSNRVGRALRKQAAAVWDSAVIDCCGEFQAGDLVNVTFRGADGGQFAIAIGLAEIDAAALRARLSMRSGTDASPDNVALIAEKNLTLLWPR
jgi:glutamate 5-kinase